MELFQLDLHLCLRSQWLRPHPHTSARRLRPRCTLPCKPWVLVYTLCIRYYCKPRVHVYTLCIRYYLCLRSQWLRPQSHSSLWRPLLVPRPYPLLLQSCRPRGQAALPHPLVLFLSPLGRLTASLVVDRSQQFPLRPHGVLELFQLDLHLCLRSQWPRPHSHTSARRLRPRCTLPCKPWVLVYTLCIRYYPVEILPTNPPSSLPIYSSHSLPPPLPARTLLLMPLSPASL